MRAPSAPIPQRSRRSKASGTRLPPCSERRSNCPQRSRRSKASGTRLRHFLHVVVVAALKEADARKRLVRIPHGDGGGVGSVPSKKQTLESVWYNPCARQRVYDIFPSKKQTLESVWYASVYSSNNNKAVDPQRSRRSKASGTGRSAFGLRLRRRPSKKQTLESVWYKAWIWSYAPGRPALKEADARKRLVRSTRSPSFCASGWPSKKQTLESVWY